MAGNVKKELQGTVTSNKMDKTITVAVKRRVKHPVYGKVINLTKKVKAHDETNSCNEGDTVRIIESKPLSKNKKWQLIEVKSKAVNIKELG